MDIIAVHAGAGYQREDKKQEYFHVCHMACQAGMESFSRSRCPLDAVVAAVSVLEDSPLTNAGFGANLCSDGTVECDASLMEGSSLRWAGVGSLAGVQNPITVAKRIYDEQLTETVLGLIHPCLLVGSGAKKWAASHGFNTDVDLVTQKSLDHHKRYSDRVEAAKSANKKLKTGDERKDRGGDLNGYQKIGRNDTVGAIAVSAEGVTSAAVSSGGVFLKIPGRVGQGCHYGSGLWAEDNVSVTVSGVGEYLMKSLLASRVADDLKTASTDPDKLLVQELDSSLLRNFSHSRLLNGIPEKERIAGLLALVRDPTSTSVDLFCSHSSPSMVFGFQSSEMVTPEMHLTRLPTGSKDGSFTTSAFSLKRQQPEDHNY